MLCEDGFVGAKFCMFGQHDKMWLPRSHRMPMPLLYLFNRFIPQSSIKILWIKRILVTRTKCDYRVPVV